MNNTPETKQIELLHASLEKMVGYHRQLLDGVRLEKEALVQAELRSIREATCSKQLLIESIKQEEAVRLRICAELARTWRIQPGELSLSRVIIEVQGFDSRAAERLRSSFNALSVLVRRVVEQNKENSHFVERSIEHIEKMKRNVLGESAPGKQTYNHQGARAHSNAGARLISKEA